MSKVGKEGQRVPAVSDVSLSLTITYYMVGQQDQHHNSRIDFDKDSLMDLALNKFKMWSSPKGGTALLG